MNDIHISPTNIPDVKLNFKEAFDICQKNEVDRIIVAGDLFTSREAQRLDTLIALKEIFKEVSQLGINITLSPGNHDKINQEKIESYCHICDWFDNIEVVDEYRLLEYDRVVVHIIPYFPETGTFKERLEKVKLVKGKKNILSIHEGINGVLSHKGEATNKELPTNIFERFDLTLVGHYHNKTIIDGTNIHYVGASRQHNFGEDEYKGYTLIDDTGKTKFIQNKVNARYKDVSINFEEIEDSYYEEIACAVEDGFYVRAVIECIASQKPLINKKKITAAGASKIKIDEVGAVVKSIDEIGTVRYNKEGIISGYKKFCELKQIDPDFGLKYL